VLGDLNLLDHFTEGGTVPGSVLPCDSDLSCAFALRNKRDSKYNNGGAVWEQNPAKHRR
jgi:hypothetical protein